MNQTYDRSDSKVEGFEARHYDLLMTLISAGTYLLFIRRVVRDMAIQSHPRHQRRPGGATGRSQLRGVGVRGGETAWHISRFFPAYKVTDAPSTPLETLNRAREIGLEARLKYVHVGNVPDDGSQDTIYPRCGRVLIRRHGFVTANRVQNGRCLDCGSPITGIEVGGE